MQPEGSKRFPVALIAGTFLVYLLGRYASIVSYTDLRSNDGNFQTLSALMRYAAGEVPIRDFYPYLGIGVTGSLVPLYRLTGEQFLLSSNMSVAAMLFLANVIGLACLFRHGGFGLRAALVATFAVLAVNGFSAFEPGNSLRPLRGALPLIVAALLYAAQRWRPAPPGSLSQALAWGLCLSIAPLWSNDFGPATTAAFVLAWVLYAPAWRDHPGRNLAGLALVLATVAGINGALIAWMGGLQPFLELQRGFGKDQFWYFGMWGTGFQVFGLADLRYLLLPPATDWPLLLGGTPLVLLAVAARVAWRRLRGRAAAGDPVLLAVALATAGGVLIPQLGGHIEAGYATYAMNVAAALLLLELSRWQRPRGALAALAARSGARRWSAARLSNAALLALCLLTCAYFAARGAYAVYRMIPLDEDARAARRALGVFPQAEAKSVACFARAGALFDRYGVPADRRMMSTYLSALNLAAGAAQPMKVDSVIHILGDRFRAENQAMIARSEPVLFTTLSPAYAPWDRWNERTSWGVFQTFYTRYAPIARTHQHVIWARLPQAEAADANREAGVGTLLPCTLKRENADHTRVEIDTGQLTRPVWGEVALDLTLARTGSGPLSPFRAILTAQEGPDEAPFVALPPARFALPAPMSANRYGIDKDRRPLKLAFDAAPGERSTIDLRVTPEQGWDLDLASCQARVVAPQRLDPISAIPPVEDCGAFLGALSSHLEQLGYRPGP